MLDLNLVSEVALVNRVNLQSIFTLFEIKEDVHFTQKTKIYRKYIAHKRSLQQKQI